MTVSLSGMTLLSNNDNESNWSGTDGADTYNVSIQGSNSESWLVSKNTSETGTLSLSAVLSGLRGLVIFWMKSDLSYYYTDIRAELESSAGNYKQFICATNTDPDISGDFKASALDYVNKGTETGTFNPAAFATTRIIVDNGASGNIRSVTNNWIDAIYYGEGHVISGTTTGDQLFTEAASVDQSVANQYGVLQNYNDQIFSQGDLELSGSALVSDSETLVFIDTPNGYDIYNLDISGSVTFKNSTLSAAGSVRFNLDTTAVVSFSMTGGSLNNINNLTLANGVTFDNVVINNASATSIANASSGDIWNSSGLISIQSGGSLDLFKISKSSAAVALQTADISSVTNGEFISNGTGHGAELSAAGDYNWENTASGYGLDDTSDAVIYNNSGAHINLSVIGNGTLPTVRNGIGATTTVISGQKTLTFTDLSEGVEVRIRQGSYSLFHVQNATGGSEQYTYTYTLDTPVRLSVGGAGYVREERNYILKNADAEVSFALEPNPSYI